MPSIERALSGDVLRFELDEEHGRTADPNTLERHGRSARTLLKDGPLRVTLIAIAAGGEVAEHAADGPITVQPLTGSIRFTAGGEVHVLRPGELLALRAGVRHSVTSEQGGSFLLTVSLTQ
ncbi:MAG TPA: cupin domain-containing protein [Longimicrobiales bacterium]